VRKVDGYRLSHLLLMGNTTDFTGTPLEPLMGDGMFRHFRPIFRGKLIANVGMTAERGNRLIAEGLADLVAFGRPYIANPDLVGGSRPALRLPKSTGKPSTGRDHAAIPTIRLSVGRRPSELNRRAKCAPVPSKVSEVLGRGASLIGAHPSQSRNAGRSRTIFPIVPRISVTAGRRTPP